MCFLTLSACQLLKPFAFVYDVGTSRCLFSTHKKSDAAALETRVSLGKTALKDPRTYEQNGEY